MCKFVCHGYSIITCLLRVKNIYRVHIWYSYKSIHSLDFRSLTHLIINIHTILLRSISIRRGDGRRKQPAARIGKKPNFLKKPATRGFFQKIWVFPWVFSKRGFFQNMIIAQLSIGLLVLITN